jgi:hypothetical protein
LTLHQFHPTLPDLLIVSGEPNHQQALGIRGAGAAVTTNLSCLVSERVIFRVVLQQGRMR